jgi:hypothetical protein
MGLFHSGVPPWLVEWASSQTGVRLAIETGTFSGGSAALLARQFGRCTTIELDPRLASTATKRFAGNPDVDVLHGSSRDLLPVLCAEMDQPAFFWLDGHWSGGTTAGADDPCPVMAELDAIAASPEPTDNVVAIDDARLFGYGQELDPTMRHWPSLVTVLERVEKIGLRTFCLDDVIVGIPDRHVQSFLSLGESASIRQRVILFPIWSAVERAAERFLRVASGRRYHPSRLLVRRTHAVLNRLVGLVKDEGLGGLAFALKRRVRKKYRHLTNAPQAIGGDGYHLGGGVPFDRTSISDDGSYPDFCQRAADDSKLFAGFRSNPAYLTILEHVSRTQGRAYLNEVLRDCELTSRLPALIAKDDLGGPLQIRYPGVGLVSPTTLRYVKVLADLRRLFGDLNGFTIAEIGVGYGGQCRTIAGMYELSSYELFELPFVNALAKRFLRESGVLETPLHFHDGRTPPRVESDLVISNYAFSELTRDIQEVYFERVVKHASRGYLTYNHISPAFFETMTAEEFTARIPGASMEPEVPLTYPGNVVVVWGNKT